MASSLDWMLGLLPFTVLILLAICLHPVMAARRTEQSLRETLLAAATLWAAGLVAGTELLSLFGAITRQNLILLWGGTFLLLVLRLLIRPPTLSVFTRHIRKPTGWEAGLGFLLWMLLAGVGCAAVLGPPNTYDALTYHLPRQVYWLQQRSLDHYATNNARQIVMPPLAEFIGLHVMGLSRSDCLINLIQWGSLALTVAAVTLLARQLGSRPVGQLFAGIIVAGCPIIFLQSSGPKNDVVVALWTCIAAYGAFQWSHTKYINLLNIILLGLALGLLVLTKGTGYLFALPILVFATLAALWHQKWRAIWPIAIIGAIMLSLNAGYMARNYRSFSHPLGPQPGQKGYYDLSNSSHTPAIVASNVVRNIANNMISDSSYLNIKTFQLVDWLHRRVLHLDRSDPRSTFLPPSPFLPRELNPNEDTTSSPAQLLMFALMPWAMFMSRKQLRFRPLLCYLFMPLAGFLLFCFVLKWQFWHVRLLIPITCLLAPAAAYVWASRPSSAFCSMWICLFLITLFPGFKSLTRPLLGDWSVFTTNYHDQRFVWAGFELRDALAAASPVIQSRMPQSIGLLEHGDTPTYLMQRAVLDLFPDGSPKLYPFEPMPLVLKPPTPAPDLIFGQSSNPMLIHTATGKRYKAFFSHKTYQLYAPESPALYPSKQETDHPGSAAGNADDLLRPGH